MYTVTLPPVLEDILARPEMEDALLLEIKDVDLLKSFFSEYVMSSLLSKKKVLVILPDSTTLPNEDVLLGGVGLSALCAVLDEKGNIDNCVHRIKDLLSAQEIPMLRQEYQHLLLKKEEVATKIHDTLVAINKSSVMRPSFKKMLLSIKMRPRKSISESLIEEIVSMRISPQALDTVRQLQQSYEERFSFMMNSLLLSSAYLEDDEALLLARDHINELLQKASGSLHLLEKELWLKKRVIAYELEEEIAHWTSISEKLQAALLDHDHDSYPSSFAEKGMPLIQQYDGCRYLRLHAAILPEVGWGQVPDLISTVSSIIERSQNEIEGYFDEYLKKLSPFHTGQARLDKAIHEASEVIKEIHLSKYLESSCQTNHLQVGTLLTELRGLVNMLDLAQKALFDEKYVLHKKLAKELDINDHLLLGLYQINQEDWAGIIEFYGQRSHLMAIYNANMSKLSERFDDLRQIQDLIRHTTHKEIHNRWYRTQREVLGTIKNEKWEIYKAICDENAQELQGHISTTLSEELSTLFPIQVIQLSDYRRHSHNLAEFDTAIFLDHKRIEQEDIDHIIKSDRQVILASSYTIDTSDLKSSISTLSHFVSESLDIKDQKLVSLDSAERYKSALALSCNIAGLARPLNIYKKAGKVLLISADDYFNHRIVKLFNLDTQHILYQGTKDPASIVETLIHHDDVHFIIENGLINDLIGHTPLWQQKVIEQAMKLGIKVHSMHTADLYHNMRSALLSLQHAVGIIEHQPSEVPQAKQQTLTFASS